MFLLFFRDNRQCFNCKKKASEKKKSKKMENKMEGQKDSSSIDVIPVESANVSPVPLDSIPVYIFFLIYYTILKK